MAITQLSHHDSHTVKIHLTKPYSKHYAALRCVDCNKHIQWVNKLDVQMLEGFGVPVVNKNINVLELFQ